MSLSICLPCFKQDKINAAVKHCRKCKESLCDTCERSHPRNMLLFKHDMINIPECVSQQLPTETCKIHSNMPVEIYCTAHKQVGCKECKRVKHGFHDCDCQEIAKYVQSHPTDMQKMFDKREIKNALRELVRIKKQQADGRNELKKNTENVKSDIKACSEFLAKTLNRLETKFLLEVQIKSDGLDGEIKEAIRSNNELLIEIMKRQDAMHSLNPVQKFVYAKILEMKMSEANALSKKYSKAKREMLEFSKNKKTVRDIVQE